MQRNINKTERGGAFMRIAILGAGAMGVLFGGYLSRENQTWLVDVNEERVKKLRRMEEDQGG